MAKLNFQQPLYKAYILDTKFSQLCCLFLFTLPTEIFPIAVTAELMTLCLFVLTKAGTRNYLTKPSPVII